MLFFQTLSLSQKPLVGPRIGTPIMRSLYRNDSFCSMAILSATNSLPKTELSIVFCRLENQEIGAPLIKNIIPVVERLVTRHVACEASTNMLICTDLPRGVGALGGSVSPLMLG